MITEATYTHSGSAKKLNFDINKFSKFKDKIIYIVVDKQPKDLFKMNESDNDKHDTRGQKLVLNGYKHYRIYHSKNEFARGKNHVNGNEKF